MERAELEKILDSKIKEAHLIGLQSGKQETSNLVDMILERVKKEIAPAVEKSTEKYTNGKLARLESKFDHYVEQDNKDKQQILEWQDKYTTTIEDVIKLKNFASVGGGILKGLIVIGSAFAAILGIIKLFKK